MVASSSVLDNTVYDTIYDVVEDDGGDDEDDDDNDDDDDDDNYDDDDDEPVVGWRTEGQGVEVVV